LEGANPSCLETGGPCSAKDWRRPFESAKLQSRALARGEPILLIVPEGATRAANGVARAALDPKRRETYVTIEMTSIPPILA